MSSTLISDITYFKMKKEGVLVSLKPWTGDIEPYDSMDEVWVQMSGIPPKWSNWRTFRQITSSLGKILEVDWNSLFISFFGMVRMKIACKDVTKIPKKIMYGMKENIYLVQFKVEGSKGKKADDGGEDGNDDNPGNGEDNEMEEIKHEDTPE
jgi:hypothetical protein